MIVNYEPEHIFEYVDTAFSYAYKVGGHMVELYYTSKTHLWNVSEDECEFIGYGIMKDGELI